MPPKSRHRRSPLLSAEFIILNLAWTTQNSCKSPSDVVAYRALIHIYNPASAHYNQVAAFSLDELSDYSMAFLDFSTLAKLSAVSKSLRLFIMQHLRRRVCEVLSPFLEKDEIIPFFRMLHSINGLVIGEVAQRVSSHGRGAPMWHDQRTRTYCLNGEDLNIVVPGPDALEEVVRWLVARGYKNWRGMNLESRGSVLGSETDFVAGSKSANRIPGIKVSTCQQEAYQ